MSTPVRLKAQPAAVQFAAVVASVVEARGGASGFVMIAGGSTIDTLSWLKSLVSPAGAPASVVATSAAAAIAASAVAAASVAASAFPASAVPVLTIATSASSGW